MKHSSCLFLSLFAAGVVLAEQGPVTAAEQAKKHEEFVARNGGYVMRKGTPKGTILVLDCQSRLATTNLVAAMDTLGKEFAKWNIVCEPAPDPKGEFRTVQKSRGADIAVFIVDDGKTPSLLAAPDERWVAVNVGKLDGGLNSDGARARFYEARCRKQIVRAMILACGGAGSTFPNNVTTVARVEDLDLVKEFVPFDRFEVCDRYLGNAGLKAKQQVIYRRAVREGWAPAPTNDVQKAIWDKAHEVPKAPMKIKFDPKKGK